VKIAPGASCMFGVNHEYVQQARALDLELDPFRSRRDR
jgi:hypothetical protein